MSTTSGYLTVRGIGVQVVYKDIKHLHIGVYPPQGRVRVAAPLRLDDERIRLAVIQRLGWIKEQRSQFQAADRQSAREMITGESHYVWGVRHRLRVIERPGCAHVELDGERLLLYVPPDMDRDTKLAMLQRWQRGQLRQRVPVLLARLEPTVGCNVTKWCIRRMKTKWGSCSRTTGQISLNLELATKHPACLEYVLVHEMTHLLEHGHGARFTKLMDGFLPDWRAVSHQLDAAPLASEKWV